MSEGKKEEKPKRSFWDSLGKLFRGRWHEVPEGFDFCDNCGRIVPADEIHLVIRVHGTSEDMHVCEDCMESPPSSWRNRYGHYRKKRET